MFVSNFTKAAYVDHRREAGLRASLYSSFLKRGIG
jgi:hypothetical protein